MLSRFGPAASLIGRGFLALLWLAFGLFFFCPGWFFYITMRAPLDVMRTVSYGVSLPLIGFAPRLFAYVNAAGGGSP